MAVFSLVSLVACEARPSEKLFYQQLREGESKFSVPHRNQSRNESAEVAYRRILHLGEQSFGRSHPALLPVLMRLGEYERVLAIYVESPTLTASTWHRYAKARAPFGRELSRPDAESLYQVGKAVAINGLASRVDRGQQSQQAEDLYKRALQALIRLYGPMDPLVGSQLSILAQNCYARGDYACAERLTRRALAIKEKQGTGAGARVGLAVTLETLAHVCALRHKDAEALDLYSRALSVFEQELRKNDPQIVRCLEEYAETLAVVGRAAEARALLERARIARSAWPADTGGKRADGV